MKIINETKIAQLSGPTATVVTCHAKTPRTAAATTESPLHTDRIERVAACLHRTNVAQTTYYLPVVQTFMAAVANTRDSLAALIILLLHVDQTTRDAAANTRPMAAARTASHRPQDRITKAVLVTLINLVAVPMVSLSPKDHTDKVIVLPREEISTLIV